MDNTIRSNGFEVCVLLAVWGESFIHDFFQLSLPSLLAPGNLPALKNKFTRTRFIFLTKACDQSYFVNHPIFHVLQQHCEIEFIAIDELIFVGNYSTTLTLAFDKAIQSMGEKMLRTYFIFLTADYIMANGSIQGLIRYIEKGYSGICAGNFQVIQNDIEPFLRQHIDQNNFTLSITPRDLLRESFTKLHPIVIASLYDQPLVHNYLANRFYFRPNSQVLAGRFYLLHMLCIKPETMSYQVGASCDYSFIPAMCPSGNVAVITDSDDYLVIEVQAKDHELNYIQSGPYVMRKLARALGEWTTQQHRENATHTIYFHSETLSTHDKTNIAKQLDLFIQPLTQRLNQYKVQPHFNHPYWRGAIRSLTIVKQVGGKNEIQEHKTRLRSLVDFIFGVPPNVYVWHPRFLEYASIKKQLHAYISVSQRKTTLSLYRTEQPDFMRYRDWLKRSMGITQHAVVTSAENVAAAIAHGHVSHCIFFTKLTSIERDQRILRTLQSTLPADSKLIIIVNNEFNACSRLLDFEMEFANRLNTIFNCRYRLVQVVTVHNSITYANSYISHRLKQKFLHHRKLKYVMMLLCGIPGIALTTMLNGLLYLLPFKQQKGYCTNIIATLQPDYINNDK